MSRARAVVVFFSLLVGAAAALAGQLASMVRDLRTTGVGGSSAPEFLGFASETAYFSAFGRGIGNELWKSDGTPEGTRLVEDHCPGECDTFYTALAQTGDRLYLGAAFHHSTSNFRELLVASGDPPELQLVFPATSSSYLPALAEDGATALLDGALLFWTSDGYGSSELYSARGPGSELTLLGHFDQTPSLGRLTRSGSLVYFCTYPDGETEELWTTDGTPGGTHRVAAFESEPLNAVQAGAGGQNLFFAARGAGGAELWFSDGTSQGTRPLSNFFDPHARIWSLRATASRAYFLVEDVSFGQEIWTSDGTAGGTRAVTAFGFHAPFGEEPPQTSILVAGERAYFFASDGIEALRLWATSLGGTSAAPLVSVCTEPFCGYDRNLRSIGSQVFFSRSEPEHGVELWTTDGTPGETRLLYDSCPGSCDGFEFVLSTSSGRLVYSAALNEGGPKSLFLASPPWNTALSLFDPLRRAPTVVDYAWSPALDSGELLYFAAQDSGGGTEPWVSGGSPSTSIQLADIQGPEESGSSPSGFAASGETTAFRAAATEPGFSEGLWLTQGSSDTTREVTSTYSPCLTAYFDLEALPERFVTIDCWGDFLAIHPESSTLSTINTSLCSDSLALGKIGGVAAAALWCSGETQIWRSDGTEAGTGTTFTLPTGIHVQSNFRTAGNHLLFAAGQGDPRLYSMPASLDSAVALTAPGVYFESLIAPENEPLGFFGLGERIWRTDGTPAGTFAVGPSQGYAGLRSAIPSPAGYDLLVRNESNFYQLWSTDGTNAGTYVRAAIGPIFDSIASVGFDRAGDTVFIVLGAYGESATLWALSDGESQPRVLHDSVFRSSSTAGSLAHRGDREYFSGCDASHGCELWVSDGTGAGTRMLHDIAPGPASSDPTNFFVAGDLLYFSADDALHGRELWAAPLDGGPSCRGNKATLCLEDGRFQVLARWTDFSHRSGDATAVAITGDTGYFWFFDEDNVELILKLIDGGGFNGHHWVYYGALSNVEYTFTVTDSETGAAKRYFNPATRFASSGDITAFGPQGAHTLGGETEALTRAATPPDVSLASFSTPQGLPGACVTTPTRFCILNNRFAVTATWRDFHGNTGTANAGRLTDDTGYLWFFNEANVEVVLKMVDAGSFNQHFWVYYGALSNVEYTLTVTDTVAGGPPRTYRNPLGHFGSFGDIQAFPAP